MNYKSNRNYLKTAAQTEAAKINKSIAFRFSSFSILIFFSLTKAVMVKNQFCC